MIVFPGDAAAALDSGHFTVTPQFRIVHPDLGIVDLSDQLQVIDVGASANDAAGTLTVTLARGIGATSLSPLIGMSQYNIGLRPGLDPNLNVFLGWSIDGGSFTESFSGRLDGFNVGGKSGKAVLRCRDEAGFYLNRTINETTNMDGGPMQDVMAAVLQLGGFSGTEIATPVDPDWTVNSYPQTEMSVMEALRQIALQRGWDVRYFKSTGKLRLYDPGRSPDFDIHGNRFLTDASMGDDRYIDIDDLSWDDADVRNKWAGSYRDPVNGLPVPVPPMVRQDDASIARYGERFARIFLDRASNISTDAEMDRFLAAALADTKDPFASHKITRSFYPPIELNDLHTYLANDDEYDQDLQLAVAGYTHHWESTPGSFPTTTIVARSQPLAAHREYRRSVAPRVIVTTVAATIEYAPEGTIVLVTDSILP